MTTTSIETIEDRWAAAARAIRVAAQILGIVAGPTMRVSGPHGVHQVGYTGRAPYAAMLTDCHGAGICTVQADCYGTTILTPCRPPQHLDGWRLATIGVPIQHAARDAIAQHAAIYTAA